MCMQFFLSILSFLFFILLIQNCNRFNPREYDVNNQRLSNNSNVSANPTANTSVTPLGTQTSTPTSTPSSTPYYTPTYDPSVFPIGKRSAVFRAEDVEVDAEGNIYIADGLHPSIQKYSPSGELKFKKTITSSGTYSSTYLTSSLDAQSNYYIGEKYKTFNITKYSSAGVLLQTFSLPNNGTMLAFDTAPDGKIFAITQKNSMAFLLILNPNGTILSETSIATFIDIDKENIIAYDDNQLFILTTQTRVVRVFTDNGQYVKDIEVDDTFLPNSIHINAANNLIITQKTKIFSYNKQGGKIFEVVKNAGTLTDNFYYINNITSDSNGNLYVSDYYNQRLQKLDPQGVYIDQIGNTPQDSYHFHENLKNFNVSNDGKFYLAQALPSGGFKVIDTSVNSSNNMLSIGYPTGIDFDENGTIFASGFFSIKKFSSNNSNPVPFWTKDLVNENSYDIKTDDSKTKLFTTSRAAEHKINIYNSLDGSYIRSIGSLGSNNGQFITPQGINFDSSGFLYIADEGNSRIQKLSSNGDYITSFYGQGNNSANSKIISPNNVDIDNQGNIYVSSSLSSISSLGLRHFIQKFDANGIFLKTIGSRGTDPGQLAYPTHIKFDRSKNVLYVLDASARIHKFSPDGDYLP